MLTILAIVGAVVIVAIVVILILAARGPDVCRIARATVINAPAEKIFPHLDNFRNWRAWSPWEKMDPDLKRDYGGADSGKGATYAWEGNKKVGQGRMEITESSPPAKVALNIEFIKPFAAKNKIVFALAPQSGGTGVSWEMQGPMPFMGKVMHLFVNMDRMVGKDFEAGLANLKAVAEK
jgi:Polyketide cyclase / dehydrase and lipid transport